MRPSPSSRSRPSARRHRGAIVATFAIALLAGVAARADTTFTYSSNADIRGINLTLGTDVLLSRSPIASTVNALAINTRAGLVYYGDGTRVYRWDPALGSGAAAHALMNDFASGPLTAPIRNMNSTSGSFVDGKYYVGSEDDQGFAEEIHELTMSLDGSQVVSVRALDLQGACNCTATQLGGFGDTAATLEGGQVVLYGATTDITTDGSGTSAGRWRFVPGTGDFTLLSTAAGGQMSGSPDGRVFTNVGNSVREFDTATGAVGTTSLFTTSAAPFDFTEGFTFDFGDAADSYGSAFHRLGQIGDAPVFIGARAPDNDSGTLNAVAGSTDGRGDDLAGTDDEDALGTPPALGTADTGYALTVQCSAGSRVGGWIDLDLDGRFGAAERNTNYPASCLSGQATLAWSALPGVRAGESVVRLRVSTNAAAVSEPVGIASDGEVEDHPLTIADDGGGGGPGGGQGSCAAGQVRSLYTPSDLPVAIGPGRRTSVSTLTVPDSPIPLDVNVIDVRGTHTDVNDLIFSLRRAGTTRTLYGPACDASDDFDLGFDDEAGGTPPCPPVDGQSYPPSQSLDVFDGADPAGTWELLVRDRRRRDGGTLESWALEICSAPTAAEEPGLRLGKTAGVDDREVTFTILASNTGNVALEDLRIDDELDSVLGAGNWSIVAPPAIAEGPAGLASSPGWDGTAANPNLLAAGATLDPGQTVRVELRVRVDTVAGSPPGTYANQASATATSPGGTTVDDLSGPGLDLSSDVDAPTPFAVEAGVTLSGRVFVDSSPDAATSHDGVRQPEEPGVAGRRVSVLDDAGAVLATTRTGGAGGWTLELEPAAANRPLRVVVAPDALSVFVGESPPYARAPIDDGEVAVTVGFGERADGIDVGVVAAPSLEADGARTAQAGTPVRYPHVFRVPSHGRLALALGADAEPSAPAWPVRLVRDLGCDARIDPGDPVVGTGPAPVDVAPGDRVCLVVDVFVPANAAPGSTHSARVDATLVLDDLAGTGHDTRFTLGNTDVTRALVAGSGRLVLEKSVRNVTRGEGEGLANGARPGEVLEYAIRYRNAGTAPITELAIDDAAPAFTEVIGGSVSCAETPAALLCSPGVAGTAVEWRFDGALAAGAAGRVSYRVRVD